MMQVDPKNVFIIPKFWGGIVSALLTILIGVIAYTFTASTQLQAERYYELKKESMLLQQDMNDIKINQFSLQDVMQNLHPDQRVGEMMYNSQLKYYMNKSRGGSK